MIQRAGVIFWDTSTLLKLYVREPDSDAYLRLLSGIAEPIGVSELAIVELHYALWCKEAHDELTAGATVPILNKFRSDIAAGRVLIIPSGSSVTEQAVDVARSCLRQTPPICLRTLDGLHLAAALTAKATGLVTTDHRMRAAAGLLDLPLVDPPAD